MAFTWRGIFEDISGVNAEGERVTELQARVRASGWPWLNGNGRPYNWGNHEDAPTEVLSELLELAGQDIQELTRRLENEEFKDDGEKRVWQRYILVWTGALNEMVGEYNSRATLERDGDENTNPIVDPYSRSVGGEIQANLLNARLPGDSSAVGAPETSRTKWILALLGIGIGTAVVRSRMKKSTSK